MANDREFRGHADLFANQNFIQIMHAPDRLTIERNNQISLAQSRAFRGTFLVDRNNEDTRFKRQTIESDDAPVDRDVLPSYADITTPNASVADKPSRDQFGGATSDCEANTLGRSNHCRVYAHDLAG